MIIKYMLWTVFEDSQSTQELLRSLLKDGYNGTMMGASSVNHTYSHNAKKAPMFSLSDYAEGVKEPNLAVTFVVDEDKLEELKTLIHKGTEGFKKIHGAMMVLPIAYYEGSF